MAAEPKEKKGLLDRFKDWLFTPATTHTEKVMYTLLSFLVMLGYITIIQHFLQWVFNPDAQFGSRPLKAVFFFSCIMAPLWEEFAFRVIPVQVANKLGKGFLFPLMAISTLLFGWGHGYGAISLLIQGVMGGVFVLNYIKNGYSYWYNVALHASWNFYILLTNL